MSTPIEQLEAALREAGYSVTAPRRCVFDVLLAADEPCSMRALAEACGTAVNRASLYRTVELFERLAIVRRLYIGWKYKLELSDRFQAHHHHAICTECGSIITLPEDNEIEGRLSAMAAVVGFTVHEHQLELRGRCSACATATRPTVRDRS